MVAGYTCQAQLDRHLFGHHAKIAAGTNSASKRCQNGTPAGRLGSDLIPSHRQDGIGPLMGTQHSICLVHHVGGRLGILRAPNTAATPTQAMVV